MFIKPSELPEYIRQSEFCLSLAGDELDEPLFVDEKFLKLDFELDTVDDVRNLMDTFRFWGVKAFVPENLVRFYVVKPLTVLNTITSDFGKKFPMLKVLAGIHEVQREKRLVLAAKNGWLSAMQYLKKREIEYTGDICTAAAESGSVPAICSSVPLPVGR